MWSPGSEDHYTRDLEVVMEFQLYLAIGGEGFDADVFSREVSAARSVVKRVGSRGHQIDPAKFPIWNVWESERIDGSNEPGDDIPALLAANGRAISLFKDPRWLSVEKWVAIVGHYTESDGPRGVSFDARTVKLVAQIEASIKVDMVVDPKEILKHLPKKA